MIVGLLLTTNFCDPDISWFLKIVLETFRTFTNKHSALNQWLLLKCLLTSFPTYNVFSRMLSILVFEDAITCCSWTHLTQCHQRRETWPFPPPHPICTVTLFPWCKPLALAVVTSLARPAFRPGRNLPASLLCWGCGGLVPSGLMEQCSYLCILHVTSQCPFFFLILLLLLFSPQSSEFFWAQLKMHWWFATGFTKPS